MSIRKKKKITLLDTCGTPQQKRYRRHRCRCMAQCSVYGAYHCSDNAICYKNNPLHIKWWNKVKATPDVPSW